MYIENKDYLKGLTILRNAATLLPGTDINKDVNEYMISKFREVFNNDRLKKISPLEAIKLHEEFKDLLPPGEEGDSFVEKLAERLVDADLLGRAAALLEYQVNNRLQGDKKAEIAIRLAAIRLLDGNPDGALRSLEIAQDTLDKIAGRKPADEPKPEDVTPEAGDVAAKPEEKKVEVPVVSVKETVDPEKQRQIYLLKARALSMKKETDKALAILEAMPLDSDVNRLRTDISWSAGRWEEAALALNDLITAEDISAKRPLTDYQRDIILNRAISLNLSGNRVALANLRERYNPQMKDTTKGQMFEIVTRARKPDMIGSRQAIESMISEIDLFKGFVDGYAKIDAKPETKTPAAAKEPIAAKGAKAPEKAPEKAADPTAEKTTKELPVEKPAGEPVKEDAAP
jgi:tetratricopeptide (TPR) repeat protein